MILVTLVLCIGNTGTLFVSKNELTLTIYSYILVNTPINFALIGMCYWLEYTLARARFESAEVHRH
jgi:hypothetical protein